MCVLEAYQPNPTPACILQLWSRFSFFSLRDFFVSEKNNVDLGVSIAGDLEELKNNLDKFKKSGMGDEFDDVDIKTLDWVEDNKKVKAFFIYESSL